MLLLYADYAPLRAHGAHQQAEPVENLFREIFEDLLVFFKEGLALGRVHQRVFGLPLRFHIGGKARAAGSYYSGAAQVSAKFS